MIIVYGISNCDTVRKARRWLDERDVDYHFHDFRNQGLIEECVVGWLTELEWRTLLNTRSTTWRKLPESARSNMDEARAIELMLQHPTLIRRPIMDMDGRYLCGFKPEQYESFLSD